MGSSSDAGEFASCGRIIALRFCRSRFQLPLLTYESLKQRAPQERVLNEISATRMRVGRPRPCRFALFRNQPCVPAQDDRGRMKLYHT
jgi:hypothetical protein